MGLFARLILIIMTTGNQKFISIFIFRNATLFYTVSMLVIYIYTHSIYLKLLAFFSVSKIITIMDVALYKNKIHYYKSTDLVIGESCQRGDVMQQVGEEADVLMLWWQMSRKHSILDGVHHINNNRNFLTEIEGVKDKTSHFAHQSISARNSVSGFVSPRHPSWYKWSDEAKRIL